MNLHLRDQMDRIIKHREAAGIPDTNSRNLRIWLEWAAKPLKEPARTVLNKTWFREHPVPADYNDPSSFMSPSGNVWSIGYGDHWYFANSAGFVSDGQLEDGGWIHISGATGHDYWGLNDKQQRAWDALVNGPHGREYDMRNNKGMRSQSDRIYDADKNELWKAFERGPISAEAYDWQDSKHWNPERMHRVDLPAVDAWGKPAMDMKELFFDRYGS